ncbi:MAG TPA: S8 family serine peptidase [Candidatus Portnoybacteria bacterium]|nr:S8 family serine peptidase [Candidatus Portnoybacteria bacterium]HPM28477.1 S8 family serine peptidase [Candidatus Portnoybacteria bacterium]
MNNFENVNKEQIISEPERLLEEGKNPGLGLRKLHEQGIIGDGILVAIIDQKLLVNHKEYQERIESYFEYGKAKEEELSMHGPGVTSLLAGKTCGVAPGVKIDYRAVSSGRDFNTRAEALNDIVTKNINTEPNKKIRVVSCSIGYSEKCPEIGLKKWIKAIKKAEKEGIIVVDTTERLGINFIGGGTDNDKDDFEDYRPWIGFKGRTSDCIIVPSDYRTIASRKGEAKYEYNDKGGLSWSVPYLSGLIALVLQVNPKLKQKEIIEIINQSVVTNKKDLKIINPEGIIELVKSKLDD